MRGVTSHRIIFTSLLVHVKNELVRGSKNPETIKDRRTSGMIRDRYLDQVAFLHQSGVGKLPSISEDQYF